jgi:hypothetical protein
VSSRHFFPPRFGAADTGAGEFAPVLDGVPFASLAAARAAHRLTGAPCFEIERSFPRFASEADDKAS